MTNQSRSDDQPTRTKDDGQLGPGDGEEIDQKTCETATQRPGRRVPRGAWPATRTGNKERTQPAPPIATSTPTSTESTRSTSTAALAHASTVTSATLAKMREVAADRGGHGRVRGCVGVVAVAMGTNGVSILAVPSCGMELHRTVASTRTSHGSCMRPRFG